MSVTQQGAVNPVLTVLPVIQTLLPLRNIHLSFPQKVTAISITFGVVLVGFLARYFRRRRGATNPDNSRRFGKKSRPHLSSLGPKSPNGDISHVTLSGSGRRSASPGGRTLHRQSSVLSVASGWLGSGTPAGSVVGCMTGGGDSNAHLTPQQLGVMGIEALDTAVNYWEDALAAYEYRNADNDTPLAVTSAEEAEFSREIQNLLDAAYELQNQSELLFLDQRSVLFRTESSYRNHGDTVITSTPESFVSAQDEKPPLVGKPEPIPEEPDITSTDSSTISVISDVGMRRSSFWEPLRKCLPSTSCTSTRTQTRTRARTKLVESKRVVANSKQESSESPPPCSRVADLREFEEFAEVMPDYDTLFLYQAAQRHYEEFGVPYRVLRTEMVHCSSDVEYLCKTHCVRLGFQYLFREDATYQWFADAGRQVLTDMMLYADKDPKDFLIAYEEMQEFLQDSSNWTVLEQELHLRGVKALTFYDVVMDYFLMDSFEDLETPPSSVTAVVQNRWLSNGFKETALATAVWSVLKAKRRMLKFPTGFMAHFYAISEHLSPLLAWGFLGPDENLREMCHHFKDQVMAFLADIFSFQKTRYTTIEELAADLLAHLKTRLENISQRLQS